MSNADLVEQAREAIDNMDDFARMANVVATGPLFVLNSAIDALEAADKRIAELEARLKSAEFWQGIYPDGWSAERIENEMHDFRMVLDGLDSLYCHITGAMASKPNTDKSVIKSLHDDYVTELCEQAEKDATEEAERKLAVAREALESCGVNHGLNGPQQHYDESLVDTALAQIGGEDAGPN